MRTGIRPTGSNEPARFPTTIAAGRRMRSPAHPPSGKLHGKVALLNGRDVDMARSIARCFAVEGARIGLCNFADIEAARELRRSLAAEGRTCVIAGEACDRRDACRRVVEVLVAQLGAVDILVNCGTAESPPEIDQISHIESTFRASTFAYLYLMAAVLPYMPKGGSIINSSSLDTGTGMASPARAAAESAIVALTQSFADAAASRGVRVNAVARSASPRQHAPRRTTAIGARDATPAGLEPASGVGAACVFLASVDSSRISGQIFHINLGGVPDGQA